MTANADVLLDPALVKTFLAVAEAGSISAGARLVFRTQSTASTQIRTLEEQLGARLFDRDTRTLALTDEGGRFVEHARRLMEVNAEALRALRAVESGPPLRVGFSEYFQPLRVAELVRRVSNEHPTCRIELRIAQSRILDAEFEARRLDLVVVGRLARGGREAGAEPIHWVSKPGLPLPARADLPLVLLPGDCFLRELATESLARAGIGCRVAVTCSGAAGLHAALRAGLGVGCLNASAIPGDLAVRSDSRLPRLPHLRFSWRARRGTLAAEVAESLGAGALLRVERA